MNDTQLAIIELKNAINELLKNKLFPSFMATINLILLLILIITGFRFVWGIIVINSFLIYVSIKKQENRRWI
ncbi:hypothetical protein ACV6CB_002774 [Clostridium perfringens]